MSQKFEVNRIVFPTDFSETANKAEDHVMNLAKVMGSKLTLLHVFEASSYGGLFGSSNGSDSEVLDEIKEKMNKKAADLAKEHGLEIDVVFGTGRIYDQIVNVAQDVGADLIVMGTHGISGFAEFFAGSNAFKVVTQSPCPVLTVQEARQSVGFKDIVLPMDSTPESRQKVVHAIELAKAFGSTLHIANLLSDDTPEARRVFGIKEKQVVEVLEREEIPYTTTYLSGDNLATMTMNHAESKKADLIIMMTEQEYNMTGFLMGQFAQQIVNHSKIPVMSVSPEESGEGFHFS
jgi:nucleotide-binding universal stress UspA family protein